jgi:hypothetical protein
VGPQEQPQVITPSPRSAPEADQDTWRRLHGHGNPDPRALHPGEPAILETALAAADRGDAGHWPTVATVLAMEVRRLQDERAMRVHTRIHYRVLKPDGSLWAETRDPLEAVACARQPEVAELEMILQRMDIYECSSGWRPWDPPTGL